MGSRVIAASLVISACKAILAPRAPPVNVIASRSEPCYTPPHRRSREDAPMLVRLGDTRAVMIEGASREALELAEVA
jgi:hypothetical protein